MGRPEVSPGCSNARNERCGTRPVKKLKPVDLADVVSAVLAHEPQRVGRASRHRCQFDEAIRLGPEEASPYADRSGVRIELGRLDAALEDCAKALEVDPEVSEVHHSLGLLLVRRGRHQEALAALERAVELAPQEARFAYVYAVALHDLGEMDKSLRVLREAHEESPTDQGVLVGLVSYYRELGETAQVLSYARKLLALDPANLDLQRMVQQLEGQAG